MNDLCPQDFNKLIAQKKKCINNCLEDDKNKYEYNNKCLKECPLNIKTYEEGKICLESCYSNQFEYNNKCYNDCPNNKFRLFLNRNICVDVIPENYYLDNNDNINKECYNICKKCSQSGNITYNNCDECINNYIFINDSQSTTKNCYLNCDFYYYFNENNEHVCTINNLCPQDFSKLIAQKRKCIDDCKKDDEYKYDYNNNCLKECPENIKIYEEEKKC